MQFPQYFRREGIDRKYTPSSRLKRQCTKTGSMPAINDVFQHCLPRLYRGLTGMNRQRRERQQHKKERTTQLLQPPAE